MAPLDGSGLWNLFQSNPLSFLASPVGSGLVKRVSHRRPGRSGAGELWGRGKTSAFSRCGTWSLAFVALWGRGKLRSIGALRLVRVGSWGGRETRAGESSIEF
ncbi:MAG: hypothetical protein AMXMBFR33_53110 [Candidatus Xenobia bacterium]